MDDPIELSSGDDKGKLKLQPLTTDNNHINISSGDKSPTHVYKIKYSEVTANIKKVSLKACFVKFPDGSLSLVDKEEYQDPGLSGKQKTSDQMASSHLAKKVMHVPTSDDQKSGKGKAHAPFSDSSDSEDDVGSEITVKGMSNDTDWCTALMECSQDPRLC